MISVIIPLFNKRLTICKTVASVLRQTYNNFELIIVDDGSTDGSMELVKAKFSDSRVRYISKQNSGVSATRNLGVKEAHGEWVAFLDADDLWLPTYLEEMVGVIKRNTQANMAGCASYGVYWKSHEVYTDRMIDKYYNKEGLINFFMCMDCMSHIGATCIKKETFCRVGGFDTNVKNNEDILLMAKIALENRYVYLGKMLHVYMLDVPGQVTRDPKQKTTHMQNVLYVINKICSYSKQFNNKLVKSALRFRFFDYLLRCLNTNDYTMLSFFINNIDSSIVHKRFVEWMKSPYLKPLARLFVYEVKLRWRLHGFQSRSHKSRFDGELKKLYYEQI